MIKPIVLYHRDDQVTLAGYDMVFTVDVVDSPYALLKYFDNGVATMADWEHFLDLTKVH